jgi:hypothetical protein
VHDSLRKLLASKRAEKPGSGWLEFLYEIQYSLNTQCHSSIKIIPFEVVFGQKANDGICVGSQETDEFIDEEKIEYMFDTDETYRLVYGQTMGLTHRPTLRPTLRQKLRPSRRQKSRRIHIPMNRQVHRHELSLTHKLRLAVPTGIRWST